MKLSELDPRWFTFMAHPAEGIIAPIVGVSFLCPHCKNQRLAVRFEPAIDPTGIIATTGVIWPFGEGPTWHRTGDNFDNLSLHPSIDASRCEIQFGGHWHGFISNGSVT
jgi:hypothetical protein